MGGCLLAAVGLTEAEAREQGYDVAVGSVPVQGARSLAIGDLRGRLKAVVNQADGEILGFHILAPHGDDLLHEVVAAMHDHGHIERIEKSIHAHPTLSEMLKAAAKGSKLTRCRRTGRGRQNNYRRVAHLPA